jgi:DNA-binding transcriptional MerR regulator
MRIGQIASQAGVGVDTVRYYERLRLLPSAGRSASGYRMYGSRDLERLQFIRRAKALGFSLADVAELLRLAMDDSGSRTDVHALASLRLQAIEAEIARLQTVRDTLDRLVRQCAGSGPITSCPIIDAVMSHDIRNTAQVHD